MAAPDYERPTDSDTNNTYILTVKATDAAGNVSTQTITVKVDPVRAPGEFQFAAVEEAQAAA